MTDTRIGNFIIAPDIIVQKIGLTAACIYGKIWRYEKMSDKVCKVAIGTLANDLGLGYKTTLKHLALLVKAGYIKDLSPELRNKPHIYKTTKRLEKEADKEKATMENLHSKSSLLGKNYTAAMENLHSHYVKNTDESESLIESLRIHTMHEREILDLYNMPKGENQLQGMLNPVAYGNLVGAIEKHTISKFMIVLKYYANKDMSLPRAIGAAINKIDTWHWNTAPQKAKVDDNGAYI